VLASESIRATRALIEAMVIKRLLPSLTAFAVFKRLELAGREQLVKPGISATDQSLRDLRADDKGLEGVITHLACIR
jgi:hypothetical protein